MLGVLALLAALAAAVPAQSMQTPPPPNVADPAPHANPAAPGQSLEVGRGSQQNPIFIEKMETADDQAAARKADHREALDEANDRTTNWIAIGALGASLLQFAALIITICVMRESTRQQLRARASVSAKTVLNFGANQRTTIILPIKNGGPTPALNVTVDFRIKALPNPLPADFKLPTTNGADNTRFTVFADGQDELRLNMADEDLPTTAEVAEVFSGAKNLHIWGTVSYEDVFGKVHTTEINSFAGGADFQQCLTWRGKVAKNRPSYRWNYGQGHNQAT